MAEFTIKSYNSKIHNIYLKGDVEEEMWQSLVDKINEIKESDKEVDEINIGTLSLFGLDCQPLHPSINIYLNTYGGSCYDMLAIYDEIKALTKEYIVNIYCVGKVMSAGTIIMLAVPLENRYAYANTTFMYHTLHSFHVGKIKTLEEDVDESKRLHKKMWEIYKENTKSPEDKLNDLYKSKVDWFITADQAKKYKIISKII